MSRIEDIESDLSEHDGEWADRQVGSGRVVSLMISSKRTLLFKRINDDLHYANAENTQRWILMANHYLKSIRPNFGAWELWDGPIKNRTD